MKISVVIITLNEESNIRECLDSAAWADDIVIVDSNSKDKTVKIAGEYTSNIHITGTVVYSEKRAASFDFAKNDWVLFLDADERVTPGLKKEILELKESAKIQGYRINRKNFTFGRQLKNRTVNPDYQLRLFNKHNAKITGRIVHEAVQIEGNTSDLNEHILHYTFSSLHRMLEKINLYSTLEADENFKKNKQVSKTVVFLKGISAFIRIYFSNRAYKDGLEGFFISFSYACVNFLSHLKLLKLQGKL